MCGAYYVTIALLIAASNRIAVESNQSEPVQTPNKGFVATSGTIDETLSRRETRQPQDNSTLYEERTPLPPSSSLERLEHTIMESIGAINQDGEGVATAAEAMRNHGNLMPVLEVKSSKRKRIDTTPNIADKQKLYASSNSEKNSALSANVSPIVSANRLRRRKPIKNTVRSTTQRDFRPAPSGPSTTSVVASNGRLNKQPITKKTFEFDLNKHPDEVEIGNSKRQRINPTIYNVKGQQVYALPNLEKATVWVTTIVPIVLADRLEVGQPTVIMNNAAEFITGHDFRPASVSEFTSSDSQIDSQLIAKKALEFGVKEHPDELKFLAWHYLRLREENDKSVHPATIYDRIVLIDLKNDFAKGPIIRNNDRLAKEIIPFHAAFLKAFNLPFHQYPQETAKMINMVRWKTGASPSNNRIIKTLRKLAKKQKLQRLKQLLDPDLKKLLGDESSALQSDKKILQEAYAVKLLIMYELFYDFCHTRPVLFQGLPSKLRRGNWILQVSTPNSVSSKQPIPSVSLHHD